ncbi:HpcH/HpaI aldolase/citrate lyase family protein [Nocardiopsis coralliicola]
MPPTCPLFIPATRPELLPKALASGADAVIVDLEDAVAPAERDRARAGLSALLPAEPAVPVGVRANAAHTPDFAADIAALTPLLDRVAFLLAPMARDAADAAAADQALTAAERSPHAPRLPRAVPLVPMVETAGAVLEARAIAAAADRVLTLAFGPADLALQLGADTASPGAFHTARSLLVLGCAAAGTAPPLDGPHLDLDDAGGLDAAAEEARRLGFGGKLAIHPRQVGTVASRFAPAAAELDWARAVDRAFGAAEAAGTAAIRLDDGTFVDAPVARRARALLARAG